MKSILVLTDFSEQANYVAEFAINIAITNKANLIFCHVIGLDEFEKSIKPGLQKDTYGYEDTFDLTERLFHFNQIVKENPGSISFSPKINCITEFGTFSDTAEKIVCANSADLVIIGSRHTNCVSRFQFGSQTYTLPDKIKCPVLLIPEGLKFEGIRMIMYATDLPLNNRKALQFLGDLAKPFNATVKVSHISKRSLPVKISDYSIGNSLNDQLGSGYSPVVYQTVKDDNLNAGLLQMIGDDHVSILALVHRKYQFLEGLFHESLSKLMPDKSAIPLLILPNSFISEEIYSNIIV
jgi:nucleotide-binding universal stress UspA family protein